MKKFAAIAFFIFTFLFTASSAHAATILSVPFTPQAPQNQWRTQPFQDACEEASIIMIDAFYHNKILTPKNVRAQILDYINYENHQYGFNKDTNAIMTSKLINEHSGFWTHLVENASTDDIKNQIDAGYPVIFSAYTPTLRNPHYSRSVNPYHVFVITGYDDTTHEFITNDPGTNAGKNYRYSFETLKNANHDWMQKNTGTGAPVVLFTEP
ncbi:MAG: C39 family peptidase [Candidatus Magasanikbacteria bacterium]|nr:C39 family peptidase [Candidatus Magasanikbacteria bacterium]